MFNNRKISILMASFPHRKKLMISAVSELIHQCDDFYLWLNEYTEIPEELKQYGEKLHIKINVPNIRDNGRYTFLDECKNDYCFICDDDINWPKNYVENTLNCFKRHGDHIIVAYFIKNTKDFIAGRKHDTVMNIERHTLNRKNYGFGSGTCAFIPSQIGFTVTMNELLAGYDVEIFLGNLSKSKKINVISPARPNKFMSWKHIPHVQTDKFALHKHGSSNRIIKTLDYINKSHCHSFALSKKILISKLFNHTIRISTIGLNEDIIKNIYLYHGLNIDLCPIVKTHREAVEYAKQNNWPFVFILEDSAYPINNVLKYLTDAVSNIPADCFLLTLGNTKFLGNPKHRKNYIETFKLNAGSHSFILFSEYYDYFLQYEEQMNKSNIDEIFIKMRRRFAYLKCLFIQIRINADIEYICANKNVIKQCPTLSEINNKIK